ncbi:MAG: fused MFS/spermidine synthase [Ignavibacteriae bacterium]|nr:fused MFS/spermidine synthase [Ignavibacteriota bacterium]
MNNRRNLLSIIALLFIVSGAAGLIYQIVWFKYLSLFLGSTTYAQTMVLASFMGGLAIGAALWGKRADVSKNPLSLYAWLELGIGVYCLAYPWLLDIVKSVFISIVVGAGWESDSGATLFLKLVVSLLTLLPPTILMGGTLPVLVRFLSHRIEDAGKNVAILYFLNSFGAVGGSILGGFFFVSMVGLQATIFSAVAVNILVGVVALILSRKQLPEVEEVPEAAESTSQTFSDKQVRIAVMVAGFSGFTAMVYEVAWVRLLMPLLGSTTYSFTLMLVAFISGITVGSWVVSAVISRIKNLFGFLAYCQIGVVLSLLLALPLYGRLPYYLWKIGSLLARTEGAYPFFLTAEFLLCFAVMVVPTIFLGMSLPVASRIASQRIEVLGAAVGNIFSVNTVGTVLGSLTAGLVLIPAVGIRHTIELAVALNLALGVVILRAETDFSARLKKVLTAVPVVLFLVYIVSASGWNQNVMLMSIFRKLAYSVQPPNTYTEFESEASVINVLYHKEGASSTVAIAQAKGSPTLSLYINGKVDATNDADLATQVLLGQYPMMYHRDVKDALVIGLGSGVTVGSMLTHPVNSIDCVEISPEVVQASTFFNDVNNRPLEDKRMRLAIDDALAFLQLTQKSYDVIVSEPSNTWVSGVGNLFTREFFQQCKTRLKDGGFLVQWFHLYEISDETFRVVLRTLRETFPHVMMWQGLDQDMILLASVEPLQIDYALVKEKFNIPAVRNDLRRIAIPDPMTLFSLQVLSEKSLERYVGAGVVNTEDLPLLEYWSPRDLFLQRNVEQLAQLDERINFSKSTLVLQTVADSVGLPDSVMMNIGKLHLAVRRGNPVLGYSMLRRYYENNPRDITALQLLVGAADRFNRDEEALRYVQKIAEMKPKDPVALSAYAWRKYLSARRVASSLESFDFSKERKVLEQCIELAADTVDDFQLKLAEMFFRAQEYEEAIPHYIRAIKIRETHRPRSDMRDDQLRLRLAQSYRHLGNNQRALQFGVQATLLNPRNEAARELVYQIWKTMENEAN